ncbi:MAG: ATP-dependent helicase [Clostridiales bacterium]|nr:ATP-dependent helicase [Clostridiales bacterium]
MSFSEAQSIAINHNKGPMLVLAGPGSGKTLVITRRTKKLIEEYGVNPSEILVITFTKAAATEMGQRFFKLMDNHKPPVTFGTFHGVFFKILKFAYGLNGSNIIREDQRQQFLREIIGRLELELDDESEFISGIISEISLVKGEMIDLNNYYSTNCSEDVFKDIYRSYNEKLTRASLIDFDDMLVLTYELFKARVDILSAWQRKFKYILIDEFQDINKIQYEIIRLMALPENNLFIVGDDDQSIYRFRGAKPEIMLNFQGDYADSKRILLDQNYRSTKAIVEGAIKVIKNNGKRFEKKIVTNNEMGSVIDVSEFESSVEENKKIISIISFYIDQGYQYKDIAILFRTNIGPRLLVEKLMEYNIPFRMKDSMPNIFEHWIAKNLFSYIKIARGNRERGEFLQIINRPNRFISRDCFDTTETSFTHLKEFFNDKAWMIDRIDKLEYDINFLKNLSPLAAINYIRKGIGYENYLVEYAKYRRMNHEELIDILDELQESAKGFSSYEEWFVHIEEYKEELLKQSREKAQNMNRVELATLHSSKGLEYKIVFIIDVNEGIIPYQKALLEEDIEEERRMFYVGMTRAKEKLHIYHVKERYNKKLEPSRFIGELYLDVEALKEGVKIEHERYGTGIVRSRKDGRLLIYFENMQKELLLDEKYVVSGRLIKIIE